MNLVKIAKEIVVVDRVSVYGQLIGKDGCALDDRTVRHVPDFYLAWWL